MAQIKFGSQNLAQDWKQLYEKHAPIIYVIVEDNGWVTLRERLEESKSWDHGFMIP